MIALVLILLVGSFTGWEMHHAMQKKRFQSELERLRVRFIVMQKLAVAMQADWKGVLQRRGKEWLFEAICEEERGKKLSPLPLGTMKIFFEKEEISVISLDFYASGEILPEGEFLFVQDSNQMKWKTSELFQKEEKSKENRPAYRMR